MGEITDLWDKIRRYYRFTPSETRGIAIAILVTAFIISFGEWGRGDQISVSAGFLNLFNAVLIVSLSFLAHISVQRIWALMTGYRMEWRIWSFGLLFGLILIFLTNGKFWLILPGGFIMHHMAGHRLGWFRYDINWWAMAMISVVGPFASMSLAVIFTSLSGAIANPLIHKLIIFNIVYALYSILPIPPLDGSKVFYGSRMLYAFSTSGIVAASILLTLDISAWVAVVSSVFIGIVLWLLYYIFFESKVWQGV